GREGLRLPIIGGHAVHARRLVAVGTQTLLADARRRRRRRRCRRRRDGRLPLGRLLLPPMHGPVPGGPVPARRALVVPHVPRRTGMTALGVAWTMSPVVAMIAPTRPGILVVGMLAVAGADQPRAMCRVPEAAAVRPGRPAGVSRRCRQGEPHT